MQSLSLPAPSGLAVALSLSELCLNPFIKSRLHPDLECVGLGHDGAFIRTVADRNVAPRYNYFGPTIETVADLVDVFAKLGSTGWNLAKQQSEFFIVDVDGDDHGEGNSAEVLAQVIEAAGKAGWVSVSTSRNGIGLHITIIPPKPMQAATGRQHAHNRDAIVQAFNEASGFDLNAVRDKNDNAWLWASNPAPNGFKAFVEAATVAPEITVANEAEEFFDSMDAPAPLTEGQRQDIADAKAAGVAFDQDGARWHTHAKVGFVWDRGNYSTTCPCTNPGEQNCFAYPQRDGSWIVTRLNVAADKETDYWYSNAQGYATCRIPSREIKRQTVRLTANESDMADAIRPILPKLDIKQRAGLLVRMTREADPPKNVMREPNAPTIQRVQRITLRQLLSHHAQAEKFDSRKGKWVNSLWPDWVAAMIDASGDYPGVPVLEGIQTSPFILASGEIIHTSGYHPDCGIILDTDCQFLGRMPNAEAVATLLDILRDFPLTDLGRSAAIAAILTTLARFAINGPVPMVAFDANTPGAGKGLLADVAALIPTGQGMPVSAMPAADDEFRKLITSIVLCGQPLLMLDNISETLGSPALEAACTATYWQDRVLGRSEAIRLPLRLGLFTTGNNLSFTRDLSRRILHIRLDSPEERPEERTGFKYADLRRHVIDNRSQLVTAALSILANYIRAGRPNQYLTAWGSFESWSDLVRSATVFAGLADPGETRIQLAATADTDSDQLRQLVEGWAELPGAVDGLTVKEAMTLADHLIEGNEPRFPTIKSLIDDLGTTEEKRKHSLGQLLRKYRNRVCGGRSLQAIDRKNVKAWKVA